MRFAGKHIWIIGASSGIGEALARELSHEGARLALSARRSEALHALNANLGGKHTVLPFDVSYSRDVTEAATQISTHFPHVDSIVFLAATYAPMQLASLDVQKVHDIINVNLAGAFHVVHAAMPILRKQDGGQLVLCGSVAGYSGLPNAQPYSATKAAVMNLAESLRAETLGTPIDIKLISPGFVATPMTAKNDFPMPMMISPESAAKAIASGMLSRAFEIHFPKRFTYVMKFLRLLPPPLYFMLAGKLK